MPLDPQRFIAAMVKIQSQSTTNAASVSQAAALAALSGLNEFIDEWRCAYQRRRDLVARNYRKSMVSS